MDDWKRLTFHMIDAMVAAAQDDLVHFAQHVAWAVPNPDVLDKIVRFVRALPLGSRGVLSVGAGLGCWEALMDASGLAIEITDKFTVRYNSMCFPDSVAFGDDQVLLTRAEVDKLPTFCQVEQLGHRTALAKYGSTSSVLFLCYPANQCDCGCGDDHNEMAFESLELFSGQRVIYIGPGAPRVAPDEGSAPRDDPLAGKEKQCTVATPRFFHLLDTRFVLEQKLPLHVFKSHESTPAFVWLYVRKQ